ncbi:Chromatin structure-remodeling complex subunit rsc9 [Ceratocystis fimbriata CBS 114723]|uniref:Chromatin structure-remodeling complex subunit rsc9 n=1 Tax=Ceratocystis fimbriata CBS 114723 TaxID=1035309 RepID=A0A2C5X396_9PEZI|nr:Chromatin structure-remodeling complex subunit rsc9 [Ceratocystis fimbriata CBS 114723]
MTSTGEIELHRIDRTSEYIEFIEKVRSYHNERGTNFDSEPRVGNIHLDLFKVFKHVVANGGYDKISDEKLAWRRIANELGIISSNEASTAFALKEKFYKNLAAYEIKFVHNQEPPPKDILEDVTAKGAGLLTRTRENYRGYKRESTMGFEPAVDLNSPARASAASNTPLSARASRGLRETPAQRVIFQPDTGPSRQSRTAPRQHAPMGHGTPTPGNHHLHQNHGHQQMHQNLGHPHPMHGHPNVAQPHMIPQQPRIPRNYGVYNEKLDLVDAPTEPYDPKITLTINVKPVDTPGNNHAEFVRRRQADRLSAAGGPRPPFQPGRGYEGPNIYLRCLYALRSGLKEEQTYALNHLVKISYERGDKYKFESFPGLVEGLVQKALEVGSYFYNVNWKINWVSGPANTDIGALDGLQNCPDILDRIAKLTPKDVQDEIQPAEFSDGLTLSNEALLTLRNMVTLPENAHYLSEFAPARDLLCVILNLPNLESTVELKHAALDIAEQITPFLILPSTDPLYISLLSQMTSNDRGVILSSLRALGRISMNLEAANTLENVPVEVLERIYQYVLLGDEELIDAGLDFLYQYTAVVSNVEKLVRGDFTIQLITYLVLLLSHGAKHFTNEFVIEAEKTLPAPLEIATLPGDLLDKFMAIEEPERVHRWIQCCFEEDAQSHITQLSAWQAYQDAFVSRLKARDLTMITPADFIRNCTTAYKNAMPQVVENNNVQKFIIKGIRPRVNPVNLDGQPCKACRWAVVNPETKTKSKCSKYHLGSRDMLNHILIDHLQEKAQENGKLANRIAKFTCQWTGCKRNKEEREMSLLEFANHIRTHTSSLWTAPIVAPTEKSDSPTPVPYNHGSVPPRESATPSASNTPKPPTPAQLPASNVSGKKNPSDSNNSAAKKQKDWIIPRKTVKVVNVETAMTRDEQNPNAPLQTGGIPLSAVLVLRNIARNMRDNADVEGKEQSRKSLLFSGSLNDLFRIMAENRALAFHVSTLIHAITE